MNGWWKVPLAAVTVLVAVCLLLGCQDTFYKCQSCRSAYKSPAFRGGFPGQCNFSKCRSCGGVLWEMSEDASGWDEERYQENGNETGGDGYAIGGK